jgi:endonuclease III
MLNQTSAVQARPVWEKFFDRWESPESVLLELEKDPERLREEMVSMLRPLGFQNRRTDRIVRMTRDFEDIGPGIASPISRIDELYGVGKYAADSYKMFFGGMIITDVEDKELKNYVAWATSLEEKR